MKHYIPVLCLALQACVKTTTMGGADIPMTPQIQAHTVNLVGYDLLDAPSARYRNLRAFRLDNGDIAVCGEVNGKNSFGAYVGFRPLYLRYRPGTPIEPKTRQMEYPAQQACRALDTGHPLPITDDVQ